MWIQPVSTPGWMRQPQSGMGMPPHAARMHQPCLPARICMARAYDDGPSSSNPSSEGVPWPRQASRAQFGDGARGSAAAWRDTGDATGSESDTRPSYQQRRGGYQQEDGYRRSSGRGGAFNGRGGRGGGGRGAPKPKPERDFRLVLTEVGQLPQSVDQQDIGELKTGLAVTWLGTSSGNPTLQRNVSCTAVRAHGGTYLVDCGEGSHRQLPAAGFDLASVQGIFLTHLHGDHCYGLGGTLSAISAAKAEAQAAAEEVEDEGEAEQGAEGGAGSSSSNATGVLDVTHVYGPPGTAELVFAQLVLTGAHTRLETHVTITELVCTQQEVGAHRTPQPLVRGCDMLSVRRLAARAIQDVAPLKAAAQMVGPRLAAMPSAWTPSRNPVHIPAPPPLSVTSGATPLEALTTLNAASADKDSDLQYSGRGYIAADGLFWDLPGGPLRVVAAQLQHRVPCWGYVMQETAPVEAGARRRKVVILGDTINSRPIAPLALGADVLSHEATFSRGMEDKCRVSQHSTGWMAGAFAAAIGARTLVLTHFSARYSSGPEGAPPAAGRGGRGGGVWRQREETPEALAEDQGRAVRALLAEARGLYPSGNLLAATDFFTLHVPMTGAGAGPGAGGGPQ